MGKRCDEGGHEHNVQPVRARINVITQLWGYGEELDGRVIRFSYPVRRCVWCGLVYGYPYDPRNPPPANDRPLSGESLTRRADEYALCEREQQTTNLAHGDDVIREAWDDVREAFDYLADEIPELTGFEDEIEFVDRREIEYKAQALCDNLTFLISLVSR